MIENFISDLKTSCKEHGIKLYLSKSKSVKYDKVFISGYFDEKTLACAMGKKDSIYTLAHESCHLDQYVEKSKLWDKSGSLPDLDEWLGGKNFEDIDKAIDAAKLLELDCEKRTVSKLEMYGIKFDKKEYIQKANAYVHFYNYLKLSRQWCHKNNTPYSNKNVYKVMPEKFMPNHWYKSLPEYVLKTFVRNKI